MSAILWSYYDLSLFIYQIPLILPLWIQGMNYGPNNSVWTSTIISHKWTKLNLIPSRYRIRMDNSKHKLPWLFLCCSFHYESTTRTDVRYTIPVVLSAILVNNEQGGFSKFFNTIFPGMRVNNKLCKHVTLGSMHHLINRPCWPY